MDLSKDQLIRYSRHIIMPEVGVEGQKKICGASVLCIGAGGLGSPLALYLAAAGIGKLGIVDFDVVDFSNLQRQIIHSEENIDKPKALSAKERIQSINSDVQVEIYQERLSSENALEIFKDYDVIVDGTDNFATRYLVNDACVLLGKPNVYGSIFRFEGQSSVFDATQGPCYRCLYPEPPPPGMVPSCAEGGVLGILPGIIGVIQATETLKIILGQGDLLVGRLLIFGALEMKFRELKLRKDPTCPICGDNPSIHELINYEEFCGIGRGEPTSEDTIEEVTVQELQEMKKNGLVILDVREPYEYEICKIDHSILIPLGELEDRLSELNKDSHIVAHCHHGGRSYKAAQILKANGFKNIQNLQGGINAWAEEIDPSIGTY